MFDNTLRPPSTTAAEVSSHEVSIPSTIMMMYSLTRHVRYRYQAQATGLPARHVFLEQPHRQRVAVNDHRHLAASLSPARHLIPASPVSRFSPGVIHQDLAPGRPHPCLAR